MVLTPLWRKLSRKLRILVALLALSALALTIPTSRALFYEWSRPAETIAFERPLSDFLEQACPGSRLQVLSPYPLRIVGTLNCSPQRCTELEDALRQVCEIEASRGDSLSLVTGHVPAATNLCTQLLCLALLASIPALLLLQQIACWLTRAAVPCLRFSPAVALAGVLCLGWPLWSLVPTLLILLALMPRSRSLVIENGLEEAAILLKFLPSELAAECFKRLGSNRMYRLTGVISRLPMISPVRHSQVRARFDHHVKLARRRLGVKGSGAPDPDLMVRTLTDFYLPAAPPATKPTAALGRSRSRRKIFSCLVCDEVFIDEDSLCKHEQAAHGPGPEVGQKTRNKPLALLISGLFLSLILQLPGAHSRPMTLPNALPNRQAAQRLIEISRLVNRDMLLVEGPNTTLVAVRGDVHSMQPLLQSAGLGFAKILQLPPPPSRLWTWLPLGLALGWFAWHARPRRPQTAIAVPPPPAVEKPVEKKPESLASLLEVDVLSVHLGGRLLPLLGARLAERVTAIQRHLAYELGLLVPDIKFRDNLALEDNDYTILLNDCVVAHGTIRVNQFLAIGPEDKLKQLPGEVTHDPTYRMPGKWIEPYRRGDAERLGCMLFDPVSVVATQLTEVARQHASQILSVAEVSRRLQADNVSLLARELSVKGADVIVVWRVLRGLLKEEVCIRDLTTILESMAEQVHLTQEAEYLTEFARVSLANAICHDLGNGRNLLNVITLDPEAERVIQAGVAKTPRFWLDLDPEVGWEIQQAIAAQIQTSQERGLRPIILTSPPVRAPLFKLLERSHPGIKVLSWNEIPPGYNVNSIGMATL